MVPEITTNCYCFTPPTYSELLPEIKGDCVDFHPFNIVVITYKIGICKLQMFHNSLFMKMLEAEFHKS